MFTIKKFPVSISFEDYKSKTKEFIIPFTSSGKDGFRGLKTGSVSKYGMIVYVGMDIGVNEILKRLDDSGQRINDVEGTLSMLKRYIKALKDFKIGNVISIDYQDNGEFRLIKEANRIRLNNENNKLP